MTSISKAGASFCSLQMIINDISPKKIWVHIQVWEWISMMQIIDMENIKSRDSEESKFIN